MEVLEENKRIRNKEFNDDLMSAKEYLRNSPVSSVIKTQYALWYILDEIDAEMTATTEDTYTSLKCLKEVEEYIIKNNIEELNITEEEYMTYVYSKWEEEVDEND